VQKSASDGVESPLSFNVSEHTFTSRQLMLPLRQINWYKMCTYISLLQCKIEDYFN